MIGEIIGIVTVFFIHLGCQKIADYYSSDTITDLGFKLIEPFSTETYKKTNVVNDLIPFLGMTWLGCMCCINSSSTTVERFITNASYLYILRGASFVMTVLPNPNNHESPTPFSAFRSDMIFSGHTMIYVLSMEHLSDFYNSIIFTTFNFLSTIAFGWLVIKNRNHYSVDIFLAIVITKLVYAYTL